MEPVALQGKAPATLTVNTVVDELTFDFGASPTLEVATTMPGMIGFPPVGRGASAPSGGGSASVSLGGTIAQAVLSQQQATADLNREAQRSPLVIPRTSPLALPVYSVAIIGGNTLSSGAQGIKFATAATSVPVAYNPATDTSMVDGVGYGLLGINGVFDGTKVLVINNGGGKAYNGFPLVGNEVILSRGPVSVPVGAGPATVTCYPVG